MNVLLALISLFSCVNAAKILCIFPAVAHSHYSLGYALSKGLANKGHEVTYVSPFKEKETLENLKNVVLTGFDKIAAEMMKDVNMFDMNGVPSFLSMAMLGNMGIMLANNTLSNEAFQSLLKSNETFDVVIFESFLIDAFHAISHHYKAPSVLVSTIGPSMWTNHIVGLPDVPSFMPSLYLDFEEEPIPFLKRIWNTVLGIFQKAYDHIYFYPKQNELVKKYFPDSPGIYDLIYNTSLILANSHVSYNRPMPIAPNFIEIGGYHVDPPKKLPEDLQKILDDSKNGVIYFSMGSNIKGAHLYPELRKAVLRVFGRLKQTILWKFEDDNLPGKPDNVIIRKWFPQNDVLAHPNVKLFITHGGLLSTIETIYHGVPIVAIPVFGDQTVNAVAATRDGYAVHIPLKKLTEETFWNSINEVLTNPKYRENAKLRSKIFHDQQVKPIDKAEYWIDYVIRHKGAPHLRSPALNLSAYQYYMIDIIIFLTAITVGLFVVFYMLIKWILGRKHPPKSSEKKVKKH